jgi:hypothetical protein
MAEKRLIDYIKENLARGYTADYLRKILLEQGWVAGDVDEALNVVQGSSAMTAAPAALPEESPEEERPRQPRHEEHYYDPHVDEEQDTHKAEPTTQETAAAAKKSGARPTGVTLFCILGFLTAALLIAAGILILTIGPLVGAGLGYDNESLPGNQTGFPGTGVTGLLSNFSGVMFLLLGAVELLGFILLWKMKKIGWFIVTAVGLITIAMNLISNLASFDINSILIVVLVVLITSYIFTKRKLFS